ncbi:MAG: EAL domain-containing protein, partial [Clostridiaceae bacterium]|nr:EAL domain-containing protein [Clostridiaceae bacterium]
IVVAPFEVADHNERRNICLAQDISKRREIESALIESERSKSVLLSHLPGLAYRCLYDEDWTMQYVSEGCRELTGYEPASLLNNRDLSFNDMIMPEYRHLLRIEWEKDLADRSPFHYEYEIITAEGDRKWVLELGEGIFNSSGEVEALEGIVLDISERKAMEIDLRYISEHDVLTGLNNRRYLENLLKNDLEKPANETSALVGINLSAIHLLNLSYGFQYTQNLIRKVVRFLRPHCDSRHMLFSTYENQLAYYIKGYKNVAELKSFCATIAQILNSLLAVERVGAGIGVVEINDSYEDDVELLLKRLQIVSEFDMDLHDVDYKIQFYDTAMEEKILREEEIKHALTRIAGGLDEEYFYLQFQPLLDLESDSICGFESLARMKNERFGQISPVEFIPIAEETKLIVPLGEIIFKKAFLFMQELQKRGYGDLKVSVNVSAIQLLKKGFVDNLLHLINEMEIDPSVVGIEITESVFSSHYQEINRILGELKQYGIIVALDDFGTGYSSLARERELNINCLKIDKYFIDKLLEIEEKDAITGDIISLAHKLGHCVIAEGIEYSK